MKKTDHTLILFLSDNFKTTRFIDQKWLKSETKEGL